MANSYKYKDGRVWVQLKKFEPFKLLLPYGLTGITDPLGNLNAVREPSAAVRGQTVISDIIRGEPGLPQFQLETRLQKTQNFLFGLKNCNSNFQAHMGECDRADNYYSSSMVMHWERCHRGDLQTDRLSLIQGDDAPSQIQTTMVAEVGPIIYDLETEFLSKRNTTETEDGTAIAFLGSECIENCRNQEDAGENGYFVSKTLVGSAGNIANVYYTVDKGETWTVTTANPFAGGMDISDIIVSGIKNNHRVIVANGTSRPANPAQIAYADVSDIGNTNWVTVDVGAVNGQYITDLLFIDWRNVFASTDDGYIYKSQDGGVSWTAVYTAGVVGINKMSGTSNGTIWAVGNSDLIVMSNDYGDSWTIVDGPLTSAEDAMSVHVTPDGTLYIGYNNGSLYGSYDEGDSWIPLSVQGVTATSIVDIKSIDDSNIWIIAATASGGKVLRSIDGGASFRLWKLNTPSNSGLARLECVDDNTVWVIGAAHTGSTFLTRTNSRAISL
jgi:photosystem II stability/assembly factor-like uncharacterized protein